MVSHKSEETLPDHSIPVLSRSKTHCNSKKPVRRWNSLRSTARCAELLSSIRLYSEVTKISSSTTISLLETSQKTPTLKISMRSTPNSVRSRVWKFLWTQITHQEDMDSYALRNKMMQARPLMALLMTMSPFQWSSSQRTEDLCIALSIMFMSKTFHLSTTTTKLENFSMHTDTLNHLFFRRIN